MKRRERQHVAKQQKQGGAAKQRGATTTLVTLVTEQSEQPMEQSEQPMEQSEQPMEQPEQPLPDPEEDETDQSRIACESSNELLHKMEVMEQTIMSQQELIASLSYVIGVNQQHHAIAESSASSVLQTQMQTIYYITRKLYLQIASQFKGSYTISSRKADK